MGLRGYGSGAGRSTGRYWDEESILGFYVSLDGKSADADNGIRGVMMSIDDPEQEECFVSRLWDAGTFLRDRNTYEIMAGYRPSSDHPSAQAMNEIPKVVFPRALTSADDWPVTVRSACGQSYAWCACCQGYCTGDGDQTDLLLGHIDGAARCRGPAVRDPGEQRSRPARLAIHNGGVQ
ncbi:hypothetical protein JWS13_44400 [Rhodococcus pseudokoreensis]|uniref:Uncharacterized protein n=1 Tax=Rhodococcus pseudokoreensis TaxID=2811421 RepID=A0A974ZYX6_9NOCA|nr:hypothetical protein [Rhodococcus pseudokoreensis]QSE95157.1 hypothetical protein JWS13_44400 [Rhodococcus pseudokoreensis]